METEPLIRAVRDAMDEAGFSQTDLARATGINQSTVSRYLNGKVWMKPEALSKIGEALGISASTLQRRAAEILLESSNRDQLKRQLDEVSERVSAYEAESDLRRDVRRLEDRLRRIERKLDGDDDGGDR